MTKEYDFETLDKLRNKNSMTGWITPDGKLIPIKYYEHLDYFVKDTYTWENSYKINPDVDPSFPKELLEEIRDRLESTKEYIDDEVNAYAAAVPPGEHPAMHCIEIWASGYEQDSRDKIMKMIYDQGWGRLGLFNRRGLKMELDCVPDYLSYLRIFAEEIATLLDAELIFTKNTGIK